MAFFPSGGARARVVFRGGPHLPITGLGQVGDGRNARDQIEQDLAMAIGDKAYQAATKDAPAPAKNPP